MPYRAGWSRSNPISVSSAFASYCHGLQLQTLAEQPIRAVKLQVQQPGLHASFGNRFHCTLLTCTSKKNLGNDVLSNHGSIATLELQVCRIEGYSKLLMCLGAKCIAGALVQQFVDPLLQTWTQICRARFSGKPCQTCACEERCQEAERGRNAGLSSQHPCRRRFMAVAAEQVGSTFLLRCNCPYELVQQSLCPQGLS